jgi:hypothetical protein
MQYKLFTSPSKTEFIIRLLDNASIPFAPDNADYQAYLKWVSEGGVPLPADE